LFVGEYIVPDVERVARNEQERALSAQGRITPESGYWYREGDVFMHFDELGRAGVLRGVTHYYFDDHRDLTRTLFADRAVYHDIRENENYWLLEGVTVTDLREDHTRVQKFASLKWNTPLSPEVLTTEILVEPDKMSIGELYSKIQYMRLQGLNSEKFELGYWRKLLQPVATIGLVFVAISFVFGPLREVTMGMRVVVGLIIGIMFKFVQDLLSPASMVFGFAPLIAILIPILMCLGLGYWLLRRAG
jgi:lipopolysaccharide export system permease protein